MGELQQDIYETEARLHIAEQIPGGVLRFTRKWEVVDAQKTDNILPAVATTYTNPRVDAQYLYGTYNIRRAWAEGQPDRSVIVFERMQADNGIARYASETSVLRDGVDVIYQQYPTQIEAPADSQAIIYRSDNSLREDGSYDAKMQYQASHAYDARYRFESTMFRIGDAILYRNSLTALAAPDVTGAGQYEVNQNMNQDGTYDGWLLYRRSNNKGVETFQSMNSALAEEDQWIYKDWETKVAAPAQVQAVIYRADNSITEIGTYNGQITQTASTPVTYHHKSGESALDDLYMGQHRNSLTGISTPDTPQGAIYSVDNRLNQDGTYDGQRTYQIDKAGIMGFQSMVTPVSSEQAILYKNSYTTLAGSTVTAGHQYRVEQNFNRSGTYDGTVRYESTIPAQVAFAEVRATLQDSDTIWYRGQQEQLAGGVTTPGYIYRIGQTIAQDGSYTGDVTYQYNKPDTLYYSFLSNGGRVDVYHIQNRQEWPSAELVWLGDVPGRQNAANISRSVDGTYNGTITAGPGGGWVSENDTIAFIHFDLTIKEDPNYKTYDLYRMEERQFSSKAFGDKDNAALWVTGKQEPKIEYRRGIWFGVYDHPINTAAALYWKWDRLDNINWSSWATIGSA